MFNSALQYLYSCRILLPVNIILILLFTMFFSLFSPRIYALEKDYVGHVFYSGSKDKDVIFVDKSSKSLLYLRLIRDEQHVIHSFNDILTGEFEGDKLVEGDRKTPEGFYYITSYMSDNYMQSAFGPVAAGRYGIAAYPLNYPNPVDRILRKTGHGIWIHGLNPNGHKPSTEGCVALSNECLSVMQPHLEKGRQTFIVNSGQYIDKDSYLLKRKNLMEGLDNFINVWTYGPYDKLETFLHPLYKSYSSPNRTGYLNNKKQLMRLYPDRYIKAENVTIFEKDDNYVVYDFEQFYCADNLVSYGDKTLYMIDGKLITETMDYKDASVYVKPYIVSFLNSWIDSWQAKDLSKYVSYYSKEYASRNDLLVHKKSVFNDAGNIDIKIDNIKIRSLGGNRYELIFTQSYSSDNYKDIGLKTLTIKGCPDNYQITSEKWDKI